MKGTFSSPLLIWPVLACATLSPLAAAPPEIRDLLRDGLYKEEVNHDADGAAKAYQDLLTRNDELRAFAATAQFRLAEVRRKQGRKDEAIAAYRLVLTRYPEAETEGKLARENLVTLGAPFGPEGGAKEEEAAPQKFPDSALLAEIEDVASSAPDRLNSYFNSAISMGHLKSLAYLLDHAPVPPDKNLLEMARIEGQLGVVEFLLKRGIDPKDPMARNTLIAAVNDNQTFILEAMLKAGLDANSGNFDTAGGEMLRATLNITPGTALISAVNHANLKLVNLLLEWKADVNKDLPDGQTPLHFAVANRNVEMVKRLLEAKADVNAVTAPIMMPDSTRPDLNGMYQGGKDFCLSPLDIALWSGSAEIIAALEKAGAKPHEGGIVTLPARARDEQGLRLMFNHGVDGSRALIQQDFDYSERSNPIVKLLAEHGVKFCNELFGQMLYMASLETVKLLFEHQCYLPETLQSEEVLKLAQRSEVIHLVVDHGGRVTAQMVDFAALNRQTGELRYLLEHGGKPSSQSDDSEPLLLNVTPEIAAILLENDADRLISRRGQQIFDEALRDRKTGIAAAILHSKSKPEISAAQIRDAARSGNLALLELLLDGGGQPDDYWQGQGFPDDGDPKHNLPAEARAMLFRKRVLPGLKESPDVRWVSTGETWEPFKKIQTNTLESRSPSPKPRPLAERLHGIYSVGGRPNPGLPALPECIAIWRKSAAGEWKKMEVHLKDAAPYPELEWGDIVDTTGPEQQAPPGLTGNEIRIAAATHISFPLTIEMDGEVREIRMNGSIFTIDPTSDEVPAMDVAPLIEHFSQLKFERRPGEIIKILRKDWPPVTIDRRNGSTNFELTSGDRVIWETKADSYRESIVAVTSPGLPYQSAISLRAYTMSREPIPAPTLFQTIAETYSYPPHSHAVLPHPDFARLRVRRIKKGETAEQLIDINLQAGIEALPAGFTREQAQKLDVPLQAGDVLEIPVVENSTGQPWNGFSPALAEVLRKSLSCSVQITNARNEVVVRNFTYEPPVYTRGTTGIEIRPPATGSSSLSLADLIGNRQNYRAITTDGLHQTTAGADSFLVSDRMTFTEVPEK